MINVSFQGERGAYSEAAARSFFTEDIETVPFATFAEVLENTSNEKTEYSVLPVENSLEGSVGESYDLLYSTSLSATGEIYHRIEHCLIGTGEINEVDTVSGERTIIAKRPSNTGESTDYNFTSFVGSIPVIYAKGSGPDLNDYHTEKGTRILPFVCKNFEFCTTLSISTKYLKYIKRLSLSEIDFPISPT